MKYYFSVNEEYPVINLHKEPEFGTHETQIEVPDELVTRYEAAISEWDVVQKELWKIQERTEKEEKEEVKNE